MVRTSKASNFEVFDLGLKVVVKSEEFHYEGTVAISDPTRIVLEDGKYI
jgi:hypothetical protein